MRIPSSAWLLDGADSRRFSSVVALNLESATRYWRAHRRYGIVALLFLTMAVNSLDRQSLSVLAPHLRDELGFGSVEYSYVVVSFLVAYTVGYAFCGRILDRVGVKLGLACALGAWSLASMMHSLVAGWIMLCVCRFLLGLGESFNSPAGVKAVAEWIPPRERGLSMAVFSNGGIFGALIAPPLVAFLTLRWGWRWSFVITGALGLILLLAWWRKYESPERHPSLSPEERAYISRQTQGRAPAGAGFSVWQLLRHPMCVGFFLVRLLTDSTTYFFNFWLPDYLQHGRGFSLAMIGLVGWLPVLASDLGGLGGGAISDWLVRRGRPAGAARRAVMFGAACLMPCAMAAGRTETTWLALAFIAVVFAAQSCWMANQLTLISESINRENVGALLALSAMGGGIGGIVSNLAAGRIIAALGYTPVLTAIGFLHLAGFGVLLLLTRHGIAPQGDRSA